MGNLKSGRNPPGGIYIHTEKLNYNPGDKVKGDIYLQLDQSYSAHQLELSLRVEQYVKFNTIENKETLVDKVLEKKKTFTIVNESKKVLYNNTFVLMQFYNNIISPGQYQYPFVFEMPKDLPGSFEYYDEGTVAVTKYILECSLPTVHRSYILRNTIILFINQSIESLDIKKKEASTERIISFLMFPKGKSTLKVEIPSDYFYLGTTVKADCLLDNSLCSEKGTNIKLQFFQKIRLKTTDGKEKEISRLICEMSNKKSYVNINLILEKEY
jgi:hypothetical protein